MNALPIQKVLLVNGPFALKVFTLSKVIYAYYHNTMLILPRMEVLTFELLIALGVKLLTAMKEKYLRGLKLACKIT